MTLSIEITSLYAALLGLWLFALSVRVIHFRRQGDAVDPVGMERAIRAQGNLTEYAPLFLILLLIGEINAMAPLVLHSLALIFCIGRLMHGAVFAYLKPNPVLRVGGMILTFSGLIGISIAHLIDLVI